MAKVNGPQFRPLRGLLAVAGFIGVGVWFYALLEGGWPTYIAGGLLLAFLLVVIFISFSTTDPWD